MRLTSALLGGPQWGKLGKVSFTLGLQYMIGETMSHTIPKLKDMGESVVSPH